MFHPIYHLWYSSIYCRSLIASNARSYFGIYSTEGRTYMDMYDLCTIPKYYFALLAPFGVILHMLDVTLT